MGGTMDMTRYDTAVNTAIQYDTGGLGGRSGTTGGRSPRYFFWFLHKRSVPKPEEE